MAAQARQAEAENRARQAVQDLYVKIADSLTPEERHAFPRWREHRRPPGHNLLDEPDRRRRSAAEALSRHSRQANAERESTRFRCSWLSRARYALRNRRLSRQRVEAHGDAGGGHVALGLADA